MFKNYFKTAWRNIAKHKIYTTINVLGLALGICACITIYLITSYEFSFDKFHPDGDRIYRIVGEIQNSNGEKGFLNSPTSDVAGFQNQILGLEKESGVYTYGAGVSIPNDNKPSKKFDGRIKGTYVSSSVITWPQYFDIFKYQWLEGNENVLNEPFKVVLTERRAHQYFGNLPLNSIIGKTVTYDDSLNVTVAGIVKDWTANTDFGYTDFISISTATNSFLKNKIPTNDWSSLSPHRSMAFVKLNKGVTAAQINARFASFIKEHIKLDNPGSSLTMRLQPLTDIHFTTDFHRGDDGDNFRKAYLPTLYALMGVALFILIIAIVNFINLSTAQSIQRAKEIGVRKVMGSNKSNIMLQFLTETFVVTLFAVILSILLVNPVLHFFSDYIPAGVSSLPLNKSTFIFLSIVTLVTSLLAGFYPSRVLASYLPVLSLKGASQKGTDKINQRKVLIVFQFTISLIFIIGVLVVGKQINYMGNADKGFNTDAIITMNNWNDREGKLKILADEVKHIPGIDKVLLQGNSPMGFAQNFDTYKYKGKEEINLQVSSHIGNEDFVPFYQMKLIAGRNVLHSDSLKEIVINETMAKAIGFTNPRDAVGKMLYQEGYQAEKPVPVVGVVADFHTGSFHEMIQPAVIENVPDRKSSLAIKLSANEKDIRDVKKVLSQIEAQWKKIFPETSFDYSFLNEAITHLYDQEKNTERLMNAAMIITIFISCMGLFGLGMFTAQRRTKEIGIRKVLGASIANITVMLSKDFIVLVLMAMIIASPVAWYFSNQWLRDFAYRTNITWWIFFAAGTSAILIALITISFQAIKAAIDNPVKSLRTE
jgi:ABC-type antimicrobial peptide transport system permease subunit